MINGSKVHVHHGDCIDVMKLAPSESFDAIVCDPPYALEFMGKAWDKHKTPAAFQEWCTMWATEAFRVLKPGGHLLAFGGTRTWHRLTCGIEDAGFEIRDSIAWLYGSGFPKSLDVSKAIDKAAGVEREVVGERSTAKGNGGTGHDFLTANSRAAVVPLTAPATPDAQRWDGWGTALKPAFEPIVVARKPLSGTVAQNVLTYGTGALNIDACRINASGQSPEPREATRTGEASADRRYTERGGTNFAPLPGVRGGDPSGRWPANVVLDEATASEVDTQSGERKSGGKVKGVEPSRTGDNGIYGAYGRVENKPHQDSGGASRFFYVAKASTKERPRYEDESGKKISHPTVKPLTLMRWLVRLVCQPGGWVLDPFAGSGATLEAAVLEGFNVVGIEREPEYLPLIQQRLDRILSA